MPSSIMVYSISDSIALWSGRLCSSQRCLQYCCNGTREQGEEMTDYRELGIEHLKLIAKSMDQLREVRSERYSFDSMSASVIWEDELPSAQKRDLAHSWGLRPIFGYRASLILGKPDQSLEEYWNLATQLFPNWVGFRPERCKPSQEIASFVEGERAKGSPSMLPALPLEYAAVMGDEPELRRLLEQAVDVDASGEDGYTAMHGAAENGRVQILALLIERGANVNPRLSSGHTPLDLAETAEKLDAVNLLRGAGGVSGAPPGMPLPIPDEFPD